MEEVGYIDSSTSTQCPTTLEIGVLVANIEIFAPNLSISVNLTPDEPLHHAMQFSI